MSAKLHEVEIWVCVDTSGDYELGKNVEQASERYNEDIGGYVAECRLVKVVLQVEVPEPTELTAVVPANQGKVAMAIS